MGQWEVFGILKNITVRPYRIKDKEILEGWRNGFWDADLETPKGYSAPGVETVIAENVGKPIAAGVSTLCVIFDPFLHDPEAGALDLTVALSKMEAAASYSAALSGAVDAYMVVPNNMDPGWIKLLGKMGYLVTAKGCSVLRRPLRPDTEVPIGPERDALCAAAAIAQSESGEK